ncbi:transmembrane protein 205-like [Pristis pectinata]|uniref:transmembrane protein 205-like n=1 Tax=Pristis pectinata TaxID=685728 RepID=UPI00223D6B0A|nr:transmembrane protein 205-like [Pristis pectinata]XP_051897825.1 transmembrane protein 205-like [Pristis pectinata]XP_051897826.1 transmembrane protein 205-like [Pristis pectinata]
MPTEGDPTTLVKATHLVILSTTWGMQIWVSFISGFVLMNNVSKHAFSQVQSQLIPCYHYSVLGGSFINLALYALYHPHELLNKAEAVQITSFFVCVIFSGLNAQWFSQTRNEIRYKMEKIELEHSLGQEVGPDTNQEAYSKLKKRDAKYRKLSYRYNKYYAISMVCNLICVICNGVNLFYTAANLKTF